MREGFGVPERSNQHWFDSFSKAAAVASISRRNAIAAAVAGAGSVALSRSPVDAATVALEPELRPESLALPKVGAPCSVRFDAHGSLTVGFTALSLFEGKALALRGTIVSTGRGYDRSEKLHVLVTLAGKQLVQVGLLRRPTRSSKGALGLLQRAHVAYGSGVSGMARVELADLNGRLTGLVDGRKFQMNRRSSNPTPAFTGSRPRPSLRIASGLAHSTTSLLQNGRNALQRCMQNLRREPSVAVARTRANLFSFASLSQTRAFIADDGSYPIGLSGCEQCVDLCDAVGPAACALGLYQAVVDAVSDPLQLFNDLDNICSVWQSCENNCYKSGGACCTLKCSTTGGGSYCCGQGENCCTNQMGYANCCDSGSVCASGTDPIYLQKNSTCCPPGYSSSACVTDIDANPAIYCRKPGEACCGSFWPCATDEYCADEFFGICCKKGQTLCAGQCCDGKCMTYNAGTSAEFQVCCSSSTVCGNACCAPNQKCYTTHSGAKVCCEHELCGGNACCSGGEICSHGRCGYGQPCGSVFCEPFTQICLNGKCVNRQEPTPNPKQVCPEGLKACAPPPNFKGKPACCNTATQTCCGSVCCNSPAVCQDPYTGQCVVPQ